MLGRVVCFAILALVSARLPGSDLAEIQRHGTLKVIAQRDEAPEMFRFSGDGEPGFEREMLEGFANLRDVELVPVEVSISSARIEALLRGDGDVIIGIVDTPERRRKIAFTPEVLPARHVAVTCSPAPILDSVDDFRRAKVGVVDGTSWEREAVAAVVPRSGMVLFPDRGAVLAALESGRIAATVMTSSDFLLAATRHPCLESGVALGSMGSAGWGVRKEDTDLLAALEDYIANYRSGPSWNRLVVKYFGDQALRALGKE